MKYFIILTFTQWYFSQSYNFNRVCKFTIAKIEFMHIIISVLNSVLTFHIELRTIFFLSFLKMPYICYKSFIFCLTRKLVIYIFLIKNFKYQLAILDTVIQKYSLLKVFSFEIFYQNFHCTSLSFTIFLIELYSGIMLLLINRKLLLTLLF